MHLIIIAVVIVSVIGLIAGLGLAVASKVMAVPVDEKAEEIQAALLTVYDMCKAVQKDMQITNIRLLRKSGGKSGDYIAEE